MSALIQVAPLSLCSNVVRLEQTFPGWWWSISQKATEISVALGPDRSGDVFSRGFMTTRAGDTGFRITDSNVKPGSYNKALLACVTDIVKEASAAMRAYVPTDTDQPRPDYQPFRTSVWGIVSFAELYQKAIECLSAERVNEFYLGSCYFSADCSIRLHDGTDITHDLNNPTATIGDSLKAALADFENLLKPSV